MQLLVPAHTDLRGNRCGAGQFDIVEVPAGSGRFYEAFDVDDLGKGFANEHRGALLLATRAFGNWPGPIP